jgi:hypothetical protein
MDEAKNEGRWFKVQGRVKRGQTIDKEGLSQFASKVAGSNSSALACDRLVESKHQAAS